MKSLELTKPVTTESLLAEFESRFNQTMDLSKYTKEELEDTANHIRTKIHNITQNTHFGHELKDDAYQKNQMMLDVVNQAINEVGENPILDKATAPIKDKLAKGQALSPDERAAASKLMASKEDVKEGVEEQSELILAAKDMMDKVTGYLEDLASMKTEGMLELADRIRDEMGAEKSDAFLQKIQPAIEQAEATLTTTRQELDNGVRILTGEEVASDPMGADDTMNMDTDLDSLDSEGDEETDEFGASDAEAGGTDPEGREQRESKEVFEASNRILGKLAGK
jgi:RNA polymerase-binding transcription factor DksA